MRKTIGMKAFEFACGAAIVIFLACVCITMLIAVGMVAHDAMREVRQTSAECSRSQH